MQKPLERKRLFEVYIFFVIFLHKLLCIVIILAFSIFCSAAVHFVSEKSNANTQQ